jgi:proline iminopeptidase
MGVKSKEETDFDAIWGQPGVYNYTVSNYFSRDSHRITLLNNYEGEALIIQGRQDPIGESTVYEILKVIPQTKINFIEQCGHFPWLEKDEQREKFYEALNNALN